MANVELYLVRPQQGDHARLAAASRTGQSADAETIAVLGRVPPACQSADIEAYAVLGPVPLAGLSADAETSPVLGRVPLVHDHPRSLGASRPRSVRRRPDLRGPQRRHARRLVCRR